MEPQYSKYMYTLVPPSHLEHPRPLKQNVFKIKSQKPIFKLEFQQIGSLHGLKRKIRSQMQASLIFITILK